MAKRVLAGLVAILIISPVMGYDWATNPGDGSSGNPYQISTADQLISIGSNIELSNKSYVLICDIDLSNYFFDAPPIAPDTDNIIEDYQGPFFTGTFDGNHHKIIGLCIDATANEIDYVGLFGGIDGGAHIKNIDLEQAVVACQGSSCGMLIGYAKDGIVSNCYASGTISGYRLIGGLIGENEADLVGSHTSGHVDCSAPIDNIYGSYMCGGLTGTNGGIVRNCFSDCLITGDGTCGGLIGENYGPVILCFATGSVIATGRYVGGLFGRNVYRGCVICSYATGDVAGISDVGGLAGQNSDVMVNCYSRGNVTGDNDVGGLLGSNGYKIRNCYSTGSVYGNDWVGGLIGANYSIVENSIWNLQAQESGTTQSIGYNYSPSGGIIAVQALNTSEMTDRQTYITAGWDFWGESDNGFMECWTMLPTGGYPVISIFEGYSLPALPGAGTTENPYQITAIEEFRNMFYAFDKSYCLLNNIDLSGKSFNNAIIPFFMGTLNGNGHKISNLRIVGTGFLGLFCDIQNGTIKDFGLDHVYVQNSDYGTGGLASYFTGTISNCYVQGEIYSTGSGHTGGLFGGGGGNISHCYVTGIIIADGERNGGLIGEGAGNISNCYTHVNLSGGTGCIGGLIGLSNGGIIMNCFTLGPVRDGGLVGGLIGYSVSDSITSCYAAGDITGSYGKYYTGGLVGLNRIRSTIQNCYARGNIQGYRCVGGLVGSNEEQGSLIRYCYSTGRVTGTDFVGGLVGDNALSAQVTQSFWDIDTSQISKSDGGMGRYTADMKLLSTFCNMGWDFVGEAANGTTDIWYINPNEYPRLTGTGPIGVIGWEFISQRRVSRTVYEYVYKVGLNNVSAANCYNVTLNLRSGPSSWTIVDGQAGCPQIDAQGQAVTADTVTVRVDRSAAADENLLHWQVTYQQTPGGSVMTADAMGVGPSGEDFKTADLSGDGKVDAVDLAMLVEYWLEQNSEVDIAGGGIVDLQDVAAMAEQWEP
jgi:hypothetical protein